MQTDGDTRVSYRMNVVKTGPSGATSISQSGTVNVAAGRPAELSRLSVASTPADTCRLEVEVAAAGGERRRFSFECPR
ncbi:MAG: hypothetical protein EOO24_44770 [Comamonadaceae bacterium]|nr:MAG: hypothetical protein EOO24_44770 [Comamonadaceae bacterium]